MRWKGKEIAILAEDHYEDPELWAILWQAILARHEQQAGASGGPAPHRPNPERPTATGPATAGSHPA